MALNHSPSIVTNGLVFAYDMGNTQKSWKGKPTTNYIPYPYASYDGTSFVFGANYANNGATYTYVPVVSNPVNAPGVLQYYTGVSDYKYFSIVSSTIPTTGTYTFSFYARIIGGASSTSNLNNSQLWRDSVLGDQSVTGDWNPTLTTQWKRYSTTGPVQAGSVLQYFLNHSGLLTGGYTIQYCGFQIELNSFATPFVSGTRYANNNLESTPSYPTWNQSASTASGGTLTFASGSYNSKGTWDLYKTYSGLSTATNYTWSALVKLGTATNFLVTMNNAAAWNTGPSTIAKDQLSTTSWTRVSITGTTSTGNFNIHLGASANSELAANIQSGGTVFLQDVRLELTGSQTALVDLTGNSTITASSLTYASDNTFSFNGSTNYITTTNTGITHGTNDWTYSAWANWSAITSLGTVFENGSWGDSLLLRFQTSGFAVYAMSVYWGSLGFTPTLNTWFNITFVRSGSNVYLYVNGILTATVGSFTANIVPGTNLIYIGMSQHSAGQCFNGLIGNVSVYNRALSAAEIQQNFNALRGRYGI